MQATQQLGGGAMVSRALRSGSPVLGKVSGLAPLRRTGALCRSRLPARRGLVAKAEMEGFISGAAQQAADSLAPMAPSWMDHLSAQLTTSMFLMADATPDALVDAVSGQGVDPAAVAEAAADTASKNSGFLGFFANAFESFLKVLDGGFESAGLPYSYGFAIIALTLLVKVGTYPLTKKQVESTLALQSLQPRVKELQAKYAGDQERLQIETAKLYQNAGVNPLAGCLPTLVTIPVFIGLYRALSNVADEGLLTEGFFWIPSLAGPTNVNGGLSWLLPQNGGAPELGWGPTVQYLILPILLVISQYVSQKIISPPQNQSDPSQQQANAILKFMPFMIGWFSLNVPSGLTLYWFANNIITTAQQAYLRSKFQAPELAPAAVGGTIVKPKDEEEEDKRPSGKELNARRSPKQLDTAAASSAGAAGDIGRSGEKFRALKAREAAKKAASEAAKAGSGAPAGASAAAAPPAPGSKFAAIKAREAAAKVESAPAPTAEATSSNGAASGAAAPAAVAEVVEAEVVQPAGGQQEMHHAAGEAGEAEEVVVAEVTAAAAPAQGSAASKAPAGAKKGGKKGGKKK